MYSLIFSLVFLFFALLAVLVGLLKAKKRNTPNVLARMILIVVSTLISIPLSALSSWGIGKLVVKLVSGRLGDTVGGFLGDIPSLGDVAVALIATVIVPIFFTVIFLIVKAVMNKVLLMTVTGWLDKVGKAKEEHAAIEAVVEETAAEETADETVTKKEKKKKKKEKALPEYRHARGTWVARLCNAGCALLVILVISFPFVGGLKLLGGLGMMATAGSDGVIAKVADAAANNAGTKTVSVLGGDLVYAGLTSYPVGGRLAPVSREANFVCEMGTAVVGGSQMTAQERAEAYRSAATAWEKTTMLPTVGAELVNAAHEDWANGESFHGVALPSVGGSTVLTSTLVDCLAGSDCQTMRTDVATVLHIVADVNEQEITLSSLSGNGMQTLLANEELISGIALELLENDHLSPLLGAISEFSLQMITEKLGAYENAEKAYADFLSDSALAYEKSVEKLEEASAVAPAAEGDDPLTLEDILTDEMARLFSDYGMSASNEECRKMAAAMCDAFDGSNTASDDDMRSFYAKTDVMALGTAEDFMKKSVVVTSDSIHIANGAVEDKEAEAHSFAGVCGALSVMLGNVTEDPSNISQMISSFGPVLDAFSSSAIIGPDAAGNLLMATLQSEKVRSSLGLSLKGATDIADSIADSSQKENYSVLMISLSNTIAVMENKSNKADSTQQINTLMKDMTPESAKVLQTMSTPELIKNYGVSEKSSAPVSQMMSDMFGNMSDAKNDPENPMSDEQYQKESTAINDMMSIAMAANDNKDGSKATFGEDSATGITATEYVDRMLDSQVMSETLVQNVYKDGETATNDPLNIGKELSEAEQTELTETLQTRWEQQLASSTDEEANKEYQKKLTAIAAVVNLPITFGAN